MQSKDNHFSDPQDSGYTFDGSLGTILRINYNLMKANYLSGSEDYQGLKDWFDTVRIVDREIDPLLNEDQRTRLCVLKDAVDKVLNIHVRGSPLTRKILYSRVDSYERQVRRLVNDKKLYMKEADDAGMALLGGKRNK